MKKLTQGKYQSQLSAEQRLEYERQTHSIKSAPPSRIQALSDATGSMSGAWESVREQIVECLGRLHKLPARFELQWVAYRDYGDRELLEQSSWSSNPMVIREFVESIRCYGGNHGRKAPWDLEEAVEHALEHASKSPSVGRIALIGDYPPHHYKDWRGVCRVLREMGRPVYTFLVDHKSNKRTTGPIFEEIAELTGGRFSVLKSTDDLMGMIGAVTALDMGCEHLKGYLDQGHLSAEQERYAIALLDHERKG